MGRRWLTVVIVAASKRLWRGRQGSHYSMICRVRVLKSRNGASFGGYRRGLVRASIWRMPLLSLESPKGAGGLMEETYWREW